MSLPSLPPLLSGVLVPAGTRPFDAALEMAAAEADPGTLAYELSEGLDAAVVLAPEMPLSDAMAMLMVAGLGLSDALGAHAPPEVAVHLTWAGGVLINGGHAGGFSIDAATRDPLAEPDWMVLGVTLPQGRLGDDPGRAPGRTSLVEEGCGDIGAVTLLESWSRHLLVWMHRFLDEGFAPVGAAWKAKAAGLGETVHMRLPSGPVEGAFMGLDERGSMILGGNPARILPLTELLEPRP